MLSDDRLSHSQEMFCQYYSQGLPKLESALKAGYSKKSAPQQASRLLNTDKIKERIEELKKPIIEKFDITRERIAKNILKIAEPSEKDLLFTKKCDILKANELLMKLFGVSEPEKKELKITDMPDYKIVIGGVIESD